MRNTASERLPIRLSPDSTLMKSKRNATDSRLAVLIISPGPMTEGGITTVVRRVTEQLTGRSEVAVTWIASHRSGSSIEKIWQAFSGFFRACREMSHTDLVHIHSAARVSFFRKSIFYWLAKTYRRPVIWHMHSPNDDFVNFFGRKGIIGSYIRNVMSGCDRLVVLSHTWVELVSGILPKSRIQVIYNPIPSEADSLGHSVDAREKRILYLAHLIQRKGYPLLIHAFAKIERQFPDWRLVFAGSGEVAEAEALCQQLGIAGKVEFLGWIREPDSIAELRRASVFALPSYQEGLPMGVLEAMANALPVVTTPVGGIPDVVRHNENGLLVEPGDIDALSAALCSLLADASLRQKLGIAAQESVQPLTPSAIADQWQTMYMSLLSNRSVRESGIS